MKVLIIGGTGVISSDVVACSIARGFDVFMLNRGLRSVSPRGARLIRADIRNLGEVTDAIGNHFFDVVVDFLSFTPEQLSGTLSVFQDRCEQFVFISSATVYSNEAKRAPLTENSPLGSGWAYADNKIKCEELLEKSYLNHGKHYTIVRPYVTYSDIRVPYAIIPNHQRSWSLGYRIDVGKPVLIWDDGQNMANIIHSKDFAKYFVGLFGNSESFGEAFHITSDEQLSWAEILWLLAEALGKPLNLVSLPLEKLGMLWPEYRDVLLYDKGTNMVFDNSKIKKVVPNVEVGIPVRRGMERVVAYYKSNPAKQCIDYSWDAKMDDLIFLKGREQLRKFNHKRLGYVPNMTWSPKEWIKYSMGRSTSSGRILRWVVGVMGRHK